LKIKESDWLVGADGDKTLRWEEVARIFRENKFNPLGINSFDEDTFKDVVKKWLNKNHEGLYDKYYPANELREDESEENQTSKEEITENEEPQDDLRRGDVEDSQPIQEEIIEKKETADERIHRLVKESRLAKKEQVTLYIAFLRLNLSPIEKSGVTTLAQIKWYVKGGLK
jgi:tRNA(Ile)-lysidine synthase TilS/MesJ